MSGTLVIFITLALLLIVSLAWTVLASLSLDCKVLITIVVAIELIMVGVIVKRKYSRGG